MKRRSSRLDGVELAYALSDGQLGIVVDEAGKADRPAPDVAQDLAGAFFHADLVADYILDLAKRPHDFALMRLGQMLGDGSIDGLVILSLSEVAVDKALREKQRSAVRSRYVQKDREREWVVAAWSRRKAGQFKTREEFVSWCLRECPHKISADFERVLDKWVPRGRACQPGSMAGQK